MKSQRIRALVTVSALAILTCGFVILPSVQSRGQEQSPEAGMSGVTTINDLFAEIGREVPEFGGMYVDAERDTLYVYAVNAGPNFVPRLTKAMTDVLGSGAPREGRIEILPGKYTFVQLKEWHDRMSMRVLAIPKTVLTGIDQGTNRIKVGIETLAIEPNITTLLAELGVPREAADIEQMHRGAPRISPPRDGQETSRERDRSDPAGCGAMTLREKCRPPVGGIQIQFKVTGGTGTCTLGFIADRSSVVGFVTNSHCTARQGGINGAGERTTFYQAEVADGSIGREAVDPCYWYPSTFPPAFPVGPPGCKSPPHNPPYPLWCPPGQACRLSDSAFAMLDNQTVPIGSIAQPTVLNGTCATDLPPENDCSDTPPGAPDCDLDWNGTDVFTITAELGNGILMQGAPVNKVGRTTGWTQGKLSMVCANLDEGKITLTCQNIADLWSAPGDSGSPIFQCLNSSNKIVMCRQDKRKPNVRIVGLLWGGPENDMDEPICAETWYSPIGASNDSTYTGVQNGAHELGPLVKCSGGVC